MHTVRTRLQLRDTNLFRKFLEINDINDIIVGDYNLGVYAVDRRICYAYSDSSVESNASMTCMLLKYGSVELAFNHHMGNFALRHLYGSTYDLAILDDET